MAQNADKNRMIERFTELVRIDALSFGEEAVAAVLKRELKTLGFKVYEDRAGAEHGSAAGNLYGLLRGTRADARPVMFSSHMDTVKPGKGKVPVIDSGEGIIRSAGETVLGADNVCGIVEILEGIRMAKESPEGYGNIEVLFTIAEEVYGKGSAYFDYSRVKAGDVYVLDMSGAPGRAARKAPSIVSFEAVIRGRASHAGFRPEDGINALEAGAKAIAALRQGRISVNTTFNVGTVQAGTADNIVAESCTVTGECRSFNHEEALECIANARKVFEEEASNTGALIDFRETVQIKAYETPEDADVCRDFINACRKLGLAGELTSTHGGSDNNIYAQKGLHGIVISCGMYRTHSTEEYAVIDDMLTGAGLVAALIGERGNHRDGDQRRSGTGDISKIY